MNGIAKMLLIITTIAVLSCHREQRFEAPLTSNEIEQKARAYLQPDMHLGDPTNKLIECFGQPYYVYETGTHELSLNFSIPDSNLRAYTNGVGGVTAFFTNNQLAHWDPIYVTGPAPK